MNKWPSIRNENAAWLRAFPMLTNIGQPGSLPELACQSTEPVFLNTSFWSERTHEAEVRARRHLTELEIDGIFDEVAAIIDEDLLRFNPLVAYYGRFAKEGDPTRIEWEREAAYCVKRDLAWGAIELATSETGFFCGLLPWYERGRWPVGWVGVYPAGHVKVV